MGEFLGAAAMPPMDAPVLSGAGQLVQGSNLTQAAGGREVHEGSGEHSYVLWLTGISNATGSYAANERTNDHVRLVHNHLLMRPKRIKVTSFASASSGEEPLERPLLRLDA